jgi:uncharacterized membrane protein HdeD (DUF308 family)
MAPSTSATLRDPNVQAVFRRAGWIVAVVALLIGLFGLIFPQTALGAVALIIGIYLIVSGITRVTTAVTSREIASKWRILLGVVGALVVIAGILVLNNPVGTLIFLVIVTGIAWIVDGVGYLVAAFTIRGASGPSAAALGVAGAVLVIAGIVVMIVPAGALTSMLFLVAILLTIVGALGLIGLAFAAARARKQ